jgi:hypothetical protein
MGCDGCSTMLGPKSGVVTRLKEWCPCLVDFHCPAHRLQLAILDFADKVYTVNSELMIGRIYKATRATAQRCLSVLQKLSQTKGGARQHVKATRSIIQ